MTKTKAKYTVTSPEVIERCGSKPAPGRHSIICPNCGTPEVFCDSTDPENTDKWFWAIRAFKVDNWSDCRSCGKWFAK